MKLKHISQSVISVTKIKDIQVFGVEHKLKKVLC